MRSAPRYDPRVVDLISALDDRAQPMAEICRRVAAAAEALGLPRPSYVHVRRYLVDARAAEDERRERREALREIAADVAVDVLVRHRLVNAYEVAERVERAGRS